MMASPVQAKLKRQTLIRVLMPVDEGAALDHAVSVLRPTGCCRASVPVRPVPVRDRSGLRRSLGQL